VVPNGACGCVGWATPSIQEEATTLKREIIAIIGAEGACEGHGSDSILMCGLGIRDVLTGINRGLSTSKYVPR